MGCCLVMTTGWRWVLHSDLTMVLRSAKNLESTKARR